MHFESTLTEIALVVTAALSCGLFLERFKQPAILGYILAGIILGPSLFGFIHNREMVSVLAELGVLMLLFVIGIELNLRSFVRIWPITVACLFFQILGGLAITFTLSQLYHWPFNLTLLLAFVFALSSTAVAVKTLDSIDELQTEVGRLTIGVLIAQDLAIVPMILVIRSLDQSSDIDFLTLALKIICSLGLLILLVWYLSRHKRIKLPFLHFIVGKNDLTSLMGLTFCFGAASISGFSGLSAAYGAFLAGLILGNSHERPKLLESLTPIYNVLMMIFFLSVGLLLDLEFIWSHLGKVLIILLLITVGKTALNISILHMLQRPWITAFSSGLVLAQLGEFSFLLSTVGQEVGIVDKMGSQLIVSLTVLSLLLSPLWLATAKRLHDLAPKHTATFTNLISLLFSAEILRIRRFFQKIKSSKDDA